MCSWNFSVFPIVTPRYLICLCRLIRVLSIMMFKFEKIYFPRFLIIMYTVFSRFICSFTLQQISLNFLRIRFFLTCRLQKLPALIINKQSSKSLWRILSIRTLHNKGEMMLPCGHERSSSGKPITSEPTLESQNDHLRNRIPIWRDFGQLLVFWSDHWGWLATRLNQKQP